MAKAACAGVEDRSIFFARAGSEEQRAAVRVCTACQMVDECLRWALDDPRLDGVWGGTTKDERGLLRLAEADGETA